MAFTTAERPIVSRIQRSRAQLEVDQAVLAAFESGTTLSDVVPASHAEELERMIRNGVKLHHLATIVEIRPTDYVTVQSEIEVDGTFSIVPSEPLVEVAFIVKRKRARTKSGENGETAAADGDDDIIEEDENDGGENSEQ